MISKGLLITLILSVLTPAGLSGQVQPQASPLGQTATPPVRSLQVQPRSAYPARPLAPAPAQSQIRPDCNGGPCEDQQPRTITVIPSPAPVTWQVHDRILWAAYIVLALLGYVGVMLAVQTLKKIERNTGAAVDTAKAAAETAHASLLHAQALVLSERPWVLVTAEPVPGEESSFEIKASNGGKSPARITDALDQTVFVADETQLPSKVAYDKPGAGARFVPIILLPGESSTLMKITRDDALGLCGSDDKFLLVESWKQRLFLCGKISYSDLIAPEGKQAHETNWCCWYIHGKQRSALVPAGTPALNAHT